MVFKVFLSSTSEIKRDVVKQFCSRLVSNKEIDITSVSTDDASLPLEGSVNDIVATVSAKAEGEIILNALPEQPINSGEQCVMARNTFMKKYIKENLPEIEYDLLISIENSIEGKISDEINVSDVPYILIEDKYGEKYNTVGTFIPVPKEYFIKAKLRSEKTKSCVNGFSVTIGEIIAENNPRVRKDNWMVKKEFGGIDRTVQIYNGFKTILEKVKRRIALKNAVIRVQDFPKPNVLFQDLSNILNDRVLLHFLKQEMLQILSKNYLKVPRDKLKFVGLDARGFIYGSILASETNGSFVMARKAGKLPGETLSVQYGTEYSVSEIEIMPHLINEDDKVIIVDDLVATGGSLYAAKELIEKCGGKVMCCITILHVPNLIEEAKKKLYPVPIHIVL